MGREKNIAIHTCFELTPGTSRSFQFPPTWSGRLWGRTGCRFDPTRGQETCKTGDSGSNQIECNGLSASPPASLAEFTTGSGSGTQAFYDVSLVDGYNLSIIVKPSDGNCLVTGCVADLNQRCPAELRVEPDVRVHVKRLGILNIAVVERMVHPPPNSGFENGVFQSFEKARAIIGGSEVDKPRKEHPSSLLLKSKELIRLYVEDKWKVEFR
ncbi:hypothetical protein Pint_04036 [Pistacia integerrima]|uniref:Uncharacterized protein n=1 Tax=Pistacia integerrima TaxID=434235 RepID=A0ACC0Z2H0_9ROSI|nr:hypothetical protein Pint_04036 [Pistacia integerrima]